ncbi:MAG TPA: hypothetical protein VJB66_00385 [Candidatus Nanoarchaeia archaeon]|nr:hypothetical protein [Candidatus Nanoarchaeia archaeon]
MQRKFSLPIVAIIIFFNFFFIVQAYLIYGQLGQSPSEVLFFPAGGVERYSPSDWIVREDIDVAANRVTVEIDEPVLTHFANTNSMDPVLDELSNGVEVKPEKAEDIHVGDVIAYFSYYSRQFIVHRVVKLGYDDEGWYAIARGDNQLYNDPGKIRWEQVEGVTVGLLY